MIERMLSLIGGNAVSATLLFAVALLAQRFVSRPALRHLLWLAVVVRLILPPLLSVSVPLPDWNAEPAPVTRMDAALGALGVVSVTDSDETHPVRRGSGAFGPAASLPVTPRPLGPRLVAGAAALELLGAALFLILATVRWGRFRWSLRSTKPASPELASRVASLAAQLGVRRVPRVLLTDAPVSPLLFAMPRATIVLPAPLLARLTRDESAALIAHELAHVHRGDAWIRPVELLAAALYWWFPLLPMARRRLRAAEEAACDGLVTRALPRLRRAYAEALLKTVEFISSPAVSARAIPPLATGAADSRDLKERLVSIIKSTSTSTIPRRWRALALVATLAAVSFTPGWTRAGAGATTNGGGGDLAEYKEALPEILAELEYRKQELALHRQVVDLHRRQGEVDHHVHELQQTRDLAQIMAHMKQLTAEGLAEEAEHARRTYAEVRRNMEVEAKMRAMEGALNRSEQDLEMRMLENELRHQEFLAKGDEEGAAESQEAARQLQAEGRSMALEAMKIDMERAKAELELRQAQYEEMLRQVQEAEAEAQEKD